MECPFCKGRMKEGQVYCEHCGKEIQIVPVFEPEIEEEIQNSMNGLVEEIATKDMKDTTDENVQEEEIQQEELTKKKSVLSRISINKHAALIYLAIAAGTIAVSAGIVFFSIMIVNYNSYGYQTRKATLYYNDEKFEDALSFATRATELDPYSLDAKRLLANIYIKLEQDNDAISILEELVSNHPDLEIYRKLIVLYEKHKKYQEINILLKECEDETIIEQFPDYIAIEPGFSQTEGIYDSKLSVRLLSSTHGDIYYTTDGRKPTNESSKYISPILLEDSGNYTISAVFVNQYGVFSEVVTQKYTILIQTPDEPDILVNSGEYSSPEMIEAYHFDGYEMYYTLDGSEPNQNSIPYIGPIPMPLGSSIFRFIMYDEDGTASEIATREYNLTIEATYSIEYILIYLQQNLIVKGDIIDLEGHILDSASRKEFICNSAIEQNGQNFYFVTEYVVAEDGAKSKSGNYYAVDIHTSELYRASPNNNGHYAITPL